MIRINLLPFRAARKKENVRRQLSYFTLSLILTLLVLFLYDRSLNAKIATLDAKIDETRKLVTAFEKDAKKVDEIKKKLNNLKKKTNVINDLERNRAWPVRLLDTMTNVIVPKRMWFTKFESKSKSIDIAGVAMDNKTVADFMTRLETSKVFKNVSLKGLERKKYGKRNLQKFKITFKKASTKKESGKTKKKRKKKKKK